MKVCQNRSLKPLTVHFRCTENTCVRLILSSLQWFLRPKKVSVFLRGAFLRRVLWVVLKFHQYGNISLTVLVTKFTNSRSRQALILLSWENLKTKIKIWRKIKKEKTFKGLKTKAMKCLDMLGVKAKIERAISCQNTSLPVLCQWMRNSTPLWSSKPK